MSAPAAGSGAPRIEVRSLPEQVASANIEQLKSLIDDMQGVSGGFLGKGRIFKIDPGKWNTSHQASGTPVPGGSVIFNNLVQRAMQLQKQLKPDDIVENHKYAQLIKAIKKLDRENDDNVGSKTWRAFATSLSFKVPPKEQLDLLETRANALEKLSHTLLKHGFKFREIYATLKEIGDEYRKNHPGKEFPKNLVSDLTTVFPMRSLWASDHYSFNFAAALLGFELTHDRNQGYSKYYALVSGKEAIALHSQYRTEFKKPRKEIDNPVLQDRMGGLPLGRARETLKSVFDNFVACRTLYTGEQEVPQEDIEAVKIFGEIGLTGPSWSDAAKKVPVGDFSWFEYVSLNGPEQARNEFAAELKTRIDKGEFDQSKLDRFDVNPLLQGFFSNIGDGSRLSARDFNKAWVPIQALMAQNVESDQKKADSLVIKNPDRGRALIHQIKKFIPFRSYWDSSDGTVVLNFIAKLQPFGLSKEEVLQIFEDRATGALIDLPKTKEQLSAYSLQPEALRLSLAVAVLHRRKGSRREIRTEEDIAGAGQIKEAEASIGLVSECAKFVKEIAESDSPWSNTAKNILQSLQPILEHFKNTPPAADAKSAAAGP